MKCIEVDDVHIFTQNCNGITQPKTTGRHRHKVTPRSAWHGICWCFNVSCLWSCFRFASYGEGLTMHFVCWQSDGTDSRPQRSDDLPCHNFCILLLCLKKVKICSMNTFMSDSPVTSSSTKGSLHEVSHLFETGWSFWLRIGDPPLPNTSGKAPWNSRVWLKVSTSSSLGPKSSGKNCWG